MAVTDCNVVTLASESADIDSRDTTWAGALAGSGSKSLDTPPIFGCGGEIVGDYSAKRAFLCFDTTEIPASDTIESVHLVGTISGQSSGNVAVFEWTKDAEDPPQPVTTADWTKVGTTSYAENAVAEDLNLVDWELSADVHAIIGVGAYTFLSVRMENDYNGSPEPTGNFANFFTESSQLKLVITHAPSLTPADAVYGFSAGPINLEFVSDAITPADELLDFSTKTVSTDFESNALDLNFTSQTNA